MELGRDDETCFQRQERLCELPQSPVRFRQVEFLEFLFAVAAVYLDDELYDVIRRRKLLARHRSPHRLLADRVLVHAFYSPPVEYA